MLLLSKTDIKKLISMPEAISAVKEAYLLASQKNCVIPLRTQIPAPKREGCFLFMPAYSEAIDMAGLKVVNVFPENAASNLPTVPAQILLIDGKNGIILAAMNGTYVTQLRTGASSGAAFSLLGKKEAKTGALIGTGSQAMAQLEAMLCARKLEKVNIYSRNEEARLAFCKAAQKELSSYEVPFYAVSSPGEAIEDADLIITATSSNTPVFDAKDLKKGATISCIGSYRPLMQELDEKALLLASKIFFDSKDAVLSESGDILIPLEKGLIGEKDFTGEIGEVILGQKTGRENEEEIIVFKSVGIAIQDLLTARMIYQRALSLGIGLSWDEEA